MDVPTVWAECQVSPTRAQAILRPGILKRVFRLLSGRSQVIKTETIRLPFCLLRYQLEARNRNRAFPFWWMVIGEKHAT